MNLTRIILVLLALTAGTIPAQDLSTYRVVSQRNIFNQNRVPSSRGGAPVVVRTVPRGAVDGFTLVGTLVYEHGQFAFFDGTSPDYRKAAKITDIIGGYKLAAILPDSVKLEADGKQFEMKVGTQLRRQGGAVQLVGATGAATTNTAPTMMTALPAMPTTPATTSVGAPPAATVDAAELLKKLMQKREQELK